MLDHTTKAATDLSLSSIIYKNDKLNKAKHYIITYIEHVKLPKLKSLPMKDLWPEKMEKKYNLTRAKYAKRRRYLIEGSVECLE